MTAEAGTTSAMDGLFRQLPAAACLFAFDVRRASCVPLRRHKACLDFHWSTPDRLWRFPDLRPCDGRVPSAHGKVGALFAVVYPNLASGEPAGMCQNRVFY